MSYVKRIEGKMKVFVTMSSDTEIRELSKDEEAEILLSVEHSINMLTPSKQGGRSLSLRVHLTED